MNRGTLSVPGTRETLLLTQIELPSLRKIFFLDLKLSSLPFQQLGDERVGFAVVLMR